MTRSTPVLHMLCGLMAAGKSTLAARLSAPAGVVRLSEDAWLAPLFADQMHDAADYLRCSGKLRAAMAPHVEALLAAGLSVTLDFPANTPEQRAWMRGLLDRSGADHRMHVLETPEALCLARLRARNAAGLHPFAPSEAQFHAFARRYAPPTPDEGFEIVRHRPD